MVRSRDIVDYCGLQKPYLTEKMKITFLIPPPIEGERPAERSSGCTHVVYPTPNIYELTVAALIEKSGKFDVAYRDLTYEKVSLEAFVANDDSDFYSFWTVNLSVATDLYSTDIIHKLRPNAYCLLLGPGPTYYIDKCVNHSHNIILRGEPDMALLELLEAFQNGGEGAWQNVDGISYLKNGKIVNNKPHALIKELDAMPFPARHLLGDRTYHNPKVKIAPYTTALTSRQCPFHCIYCVPSSLTFAREIENRRINGRKPPVAMRSVENVAEELKMLAERGYKAIGFMDDNFIWTEERTKGLCDALRKYGFKWGCQARVDEITEPIAKMLGESGCTYVDLGVESFNDEILKYIKKGITRDQIYTAIDLLQKYNVPVKLNILIGTSPLETRETLRDTIRRAKKLHVDQIMFNIVTPFPGTEFYDLAMRNKWIITGDYIPTDVQRNSIISYPNLSAAEMERILFRANLGYFLSPSFVLKQLPRFRSLKEIVSALKALKIKLFG